MTKYTSNEQYESDKARVVAKLSRHLHNKSIMRSESIFTNDILDLLNQSKWIGTNEEADNNNWVTFTIRLDAENFANKLISEGANDVAIQVLTNRIHSKHGIVGIATFKVCKDFIK